MNCESVVDNLALFLYGELSFEDEEAVQEHLAGCEPCRRALEAERALHAALTEASLEPPPGLLDGCRSALSVGLSQAAAQRRNWFLRLWDWTARPIPSAWLRPAGAVALVVAGFFAGRLFQPSPGPQFAQKAPAAAQVRYLEPQSSGDVRIVLDESRQRVVSGTLEDSATRNLLLQTAQAANDPLLRMDSVVILARRGDSPEVRQVLLHALRNDSNPAVRLKAIDALSSYGHEPQVRRALAETLLRDENLGVRTHAVDFLRHNLDLGLEAVLLQVLDTEQNDYIRSQCRLMLEAINASTETF